MDCKTAQRMVSSYIRRELKDRELEEFLDHIRDCKECHEELEIYFTIHFALRKLDEEKDVSFNIQQMLRDDLRLSERRVRRRKLARWISWILVILAELVLALLLVTQYQMSLERDVQKTHLFKLFYGESEQLEEGQGGSGSAGEEQEKKKKKAPEQRREAQSADTDSPQEQGSTES